jgi:hypothetical protein
MVSAERRVGDSESLPVKNRRATRVFLSIVLALFVGAESANEARACPNCKEAVTSSEGEVAGASMGYNWSVVFMLCVPFSMLGTGMVIVRRAVKRGLLPEM